jgi:hypothetical protein
MPNFTNPEAFQYEAAALLAAGYSAFPMTFNWKYDVDNEFYPTETGQTREDIQSQTIHWLIKHQYLYCEYGFSQYWKGLGLTERGLIALNSVPDALTGKEPLGKRLTIAVGKGSLDVIKQLLPTFIQQSITG